MKAKEINEFRLFGDANSRENATLFSKRFKLNLQGNQGFVVPWQMTEKHFEGKWGEQIRGYDHF